jgi:S1-C subfamily serine protease
MSITLAVAMSALCFASTSIAADVDDYELQHARQSLFHEAVERASRYVVQIETIGGAQPRDQRIAQRPAQDDGTEQPDDEDEDGTPTEEPSPFSDTLGGNFLVADGPTTGIIYESDGYILTSSFNFVREPTHITVRLADGRHYVANLLARDKVRKLALLKIDETGLDTPEWVPDDEIHLGQTAIALGRGFGGDRPSVTVGIVSALNRMMGNGVQTDAKLSPANYGGPLVDLEGRILGICAPMAQRPGELAGVEFYDAGIGFVVPHSRAQEIAEDLKQGRSYYRGWLGVRFNARSKDGLAIVAVGKPSPVYEVGIRPGDVIVGANGRDVHSPKHIVQALYMVPAGESVHLLVRRNGLVYGYEITLARAVDLGDTIDEKPVDPDKSFPGWNDLGWP